MSAINPRLVLCYISGRLHFILEAPKSLYYHLHEPLYCLVPGCKSQIYASVAVHGLIAYPNSYYRVCILSPLSYGGGRGGGGIIKGLGKSWGMNYTVGFTSLISNSKPLFPSGSHSAAPTFLAKNIQDNSIAYCENES